MSRRLPFRRRFARPPLSPALSSRALLGAGFALLLAACGAREPLPLAVDTRNDQCASCRMAVSDPRFAAQIVAPGEEPRFFDDLGCLRDTLKEKPLSADAIVFVADHRTGVFVRAAGATFTRVEGLATPMGSHLVAHADAASRAADPLAARGTPVPSAEVLGK